MIEATFKEIIKRRTTILWVAALVFTLASFMEFSSAVSLDREVSRLEDVIHKRQLVLEQYAQQTLDLPDDEFVHFEEFPEDMVLYRYFNDTIHSWINQFPIANDDIDFFPFGYRINHLNSRVVTNTPLAYLSLSEQYVNLGSAWYVVNVYIKDNQTVIAALLIQTDYPTENAVLSNKINPNLSLRRQLSIVPVTYDESYIIHGKNGGVLFSVLKNLPSTAEETGVLLRWFAILFVMLALFANLRKNRRVWDFFLLLAGMVLVRFVAMYQAKELQGELEIFSPNLYADYGLFSSLGDLLINNMMIVLLVASLFMIRISLARLVLDSSRWFKLGMGLLFLAIPLAIVPYIHYSIHSLIMNSNITMEPFRISEIDIYTLLVYVSYSLLFMALVLSLQLLRPFFGRKRVKSFMKRKPLMIYITAISLYTLAIVSYYGFQKEYDRNRVWTTKMSVERDLNLELQLRGFEKFIENDPIIYNWITVSTDIDIVNNTLEIVHNRLAEAYFWNILQRYDMRLVPCLENTFIINDVSSQESQLCNTHYQNEIMRYGSPLGERSRFFFMNNYNGKISYLGVFPYYRAGREFRLYIELDSKFLRESVGFPDLLIDHKKIEGFNIPGGYSYGKYLNNRLVSYGGSFNYPINNENEYESGYQMERGEGYIHFVNKVSEENIIVMSRPERTIFPYLVSFSYLMLLYSLVILGMLRIRKINLLYNVPKNSFRWKIMVLIISSLVFALLAIGAGSIWFSVRYFNENIRSQMEEKMNSVQSSLSYYSKFATRFNDPQFNTLRLLEEMNRLSGTAQVDINVYRADGLLLRTTRNEIFDRFLLGARMNPDAFREIVHNNKKQFVNREKIGDLMYYSLYAPLFNVDGKLIAIVNIPYFSRQSDFREDASSIIAAIINIYILLLIGAVFVGIALSNSISRPLIEISRKMQLLDISEKPEHINYNNRDELGILVAAYNKMVDDVNESTQRLAQGEREQAWREMARQIAHEIKNPLTPMRLSIQHMMRLKQQDVPDWTDRFDALAKSLIEQIDILSEAAGEFSSFSRFYSEEQSRFDLNTLIREQIILFNTRDNVSLMFESNIKDAFVLARKTQLTRVFVNLISNAVQAVENLEDGRIIVSIDREEPFYRIAVEDNGTGVPDSLTHRLFKPNFTTKSGGTGLGLAICRSIMEQSQGTVHYEKSQRLEGAAFVVRIPGKRYF
jgi:two-component system nitrogen regulation sensor histidine kinase NtrY